MCPHNLILSCYYICVLILYTLILLHVSAYHHRPQVVLAAASVQRTRTRTSVVAGTELGQKRPDGSVSRGYPNRCATEQVAESSLRSLRP